MPTLEAPAKTESVRDRRDSDTLERITVILRVSDNPLIALKTLDSEVEIANVSERLLTPSENLLKDTNLLAPIKIEDEMPLMFSENLATAVNREAALMTESDKSDILPLVTVTSLFTEFMRLSAEDREKAPSLDNATLLDAAVETESDSARM